MVKKKGQGPEPQGTNMLKMLKEVRTVKEKKYDEKNRIAKVRVKCTTEGHGAPAVKNQETCWYVL